MADFTQNTASGNPSSALLIWNCGITAGGILNFRARTSAEFEIEEEHRNAALG